MGAYQLGARIEARRAVRRAVQLDCAVYAEAWDEPVVHRATNVSEHGLWIETDLLLDVGTEVSVVFSPPDWREPLYAAGRIQRVLLRRRRMDPRGAGMAVAFEGLRPDERRRLSRSLAALSRVLSPSSSHVRTLIGIPVAPDAASGESGFQTRTILGWAAPSAAPKGRAMLSQERRVRRAANLEASAASAFGGGLGLLSSVFSRQPARDE